MLGTAYKLWTLENVEEETKFKFMLFASRATFSKLFPDTRTDEANNTDDTYIFWPRFSPKIDEELHTPPWPLLHFCVISNTPPSNFLLITFRWPVHPISGEFPSSNSTIFSTSTTTLSAFNNSRYLFRCSPGMPVLQLQALSCISYPRWSHPKSLGQRQEGLVMTHYMFHVLSAPLLDLWAHPLSGPALLLLRGHFPYQDQCPGLSMWRCQVGVKIL